ncbi:MAG: trigger factor, partial [Desulfobacterales bacterium]|nr:trigger factor [Desulfobacterales bacterium]
MTEENKPDQLEQNVTIEEVGPARKKVCIEIPESRITDKLSENFNDLQAEAVLPGFRRGRAPQRLIEKRFGGDVRKEVKTQLMSESFQQVVEDNNLRVLGDPDIKDIDTIELPESGSLSFEVEVEVAPEFDLPDLTDIAVTKTVVPVSDDQIDIEIERFCEMQGQMKPTDDKITEQDYLTTRLTIKSADGETVIEKDENIYVPGESRKFKGVVNGIIVENLGKELMGKTTGDAVTVTATGPKQHENEALREAELTIDIDITRTERMEPAKVEDLLPMFGFESEDALREQIKDNLTQRAEADAENDMHGQVIDQLLEKIAFDLPEGLTGRQAERVLQRRQLDLMYRGTSQQEIEEQLAELREDSKAEAQKEMKSFFSLDKAAEQLEIEVG